MSHGGLSPPKKFGFQTSWQPNQTSDLLQIHKTETYPPNWHIRTDNNTAGHKLYTENPSKPTTRGLHVHVSEDCKTGYISSTVPHYWRPTTHSLMTPNLNVSCQAVPQLCKVPLASSGSRHHSHTDRNYTSYILAHQLPKTKTDTALQLQDDTKQSSSISKETHSNKAWHHCIQEQTTYEVTRGQSWRSALFTATNSNIYCKEW